MKKFSSLIVCLLTCFLTIIIATGCDACSGGSNTITLDAGAGAQIEATTIEVSEGQEYRLPTPTKVGYNFLGWKNGSENFNAVGVWNLKDDITLTANWEGKVYNVNLKTNGGELENSTFKVEYGTTYTLPVPTKEGHDFVGWTYNGELVANGTWNLDVDAIEFEAEWKPSTTKITFDLNGGNLINTTETTANVVYGTDYTFPTVENGSHKIFKCWKNLTTGQEYTTNVIWNVEDAEITLTAIWLNDKHTLKLNLDGATEFNCELQESLACETEYVLPTVAKKGYTFLGWYVDDTKIETATYPIKDDVTITAKWQKIVTTVNYSGDGIDFDADTIEYGIEYQLENLDSSIYLGWRIKDNKQRVEYSGIWNIEATEITLEPVLISEACTVKFSGEYVDIEDKVYVVGETVIAPIPTKTKPGYEFIGWKKLGTEIFINFGVWEQTGTLELVADWKIKTFTISFDANGGEFIDGETLLEEQEVIIYGTEFDFTDYNPSYAGYEFIGWMYDDTLLTPVDAEELFLEGKVILEKGEWKFDGETEITLKAVWISLETGFGPNA